MIEALRLLIPLWCANALVNIFDYFRKKYHFPDYPLDGNRLWFDGRRILGSAKTIPGIPVLLLGGYVGGMLIHSQNGLLPGFAVLLGEIIFGFIKRRIGINQGDSLIIIDQADYLFAFYLLMILFRMTVDSKIIFIALGITIPVHLLSNIIAYKLKIRERFM
ncbi:MAG: CDP-archaeol synthase [Patescibacteria group bacterium]|jgi:CDP-2,3-bis-(O-geranylgeranyl)-sn-glycerol synthase